MDRLFARADCRQASILIELAPSDDLVGIHLMATSDHRNRGAELENFAHFRDLLFDRTPAALLRSSHNFDKFDVVTGLNHRQKITSV